MADIVYVYEGKVYLNLTNECPCRCKFCIRKNGIGLGSSELLWHKETPVLDQVIQAVDAFDFKQWNEVVICGYGEPTCSLDVLLGICTYIKKKYGFKIRLNTNGLGNLINHKNIVKEVCENIDSISISLNAPTAAKYYDISKPAFGIGSFNAMIEFAQECKKYLDKVFFSVVNVIPESDIEDCRELSAALGIPLRVREYTS